MSRVPAAKLLGRGLEARAGELRDSEMTGCAAPARRPHGTPPRGRLPPNQAGLRPILKKTRMVVRNPQKEAEDAEDSDNFEADDAAGDYFHGCAKSLQPQGDAGRWSGAHADAIVGSGRPSKATGVAAETAERARAGQALATQLYQSSMRLHPIGNQPAVAAKTLAVHGAAIRNDGRNPPGMVGGKRSMPARQGVLAQDPMMAGQVVHGVRRGMVGGADYEPPAAAARVVRRRRPAGPSDARRSRGAVVGAYMREHGCGMGEASRAVAEQGLW